MPKKIPFAQYVFGRLAQLNCHSIHGVPGDFFLRALDHTTPARNSGPRWIGNASELCAGYAADGYARAATQIARKQAVSFTPTVGALYSTYGVGELSAINAVAGSYAESIPVVHLVGTPSRRAMVRGDLKRPIHHSLANGNMEVWADMARNVTCAQAYLHKVGSTTSAADTLDAVLETAVLKSKPVYASIPSDLIDAEVHADILQKPLKLSPPVNDKGTEDELLHVLLEKIRSADSSLVIADGLSYPMQLHEEINDLVCLTGIQSMSYMSGKGIVEEGNLTWDPAMPNSTTSSQQVDLAMYFGPLLADTNTARWSAVPESRDTVCFNLEDVEINGRLYQVRSKAFLRRLIDTLAKEPVEKSATSRDGDKYEGSLMRHSGDDSTHQKITQDWFWPSLSNYLQPNDTVLLANGTPLIGGRALSLKSKSSVIASSIWCSIGQMLPAAQGVAAAKRDHGLPGRTILFEGDGSFQVTCQSISDILRNDLDVTIFLVNNRGYTYERWLNGMTSSYNDVPNWRYTEAGRFFGGGEDRIRSCRAETRGDLLQILHDESTSDGKGLRIYEIFMEPEDVPEQSKSGLRKASDALSSS